MFMGHFKRTPNQVQLATAILDFTDRGSFPSTLDLQKMLGWTSSRQYLSEAIENLEGHGYVSRRYGKELGPWAKGKKCFVLPTGRCYHAFRGSLEGFRPESLSVL